MRSVTAPEGLGTVTETQRDMYEVRRDLDRICVRISDAIHHLEGSAPLADEAREELEGLRMYLLDSVIPLAEDLVNGSPWDVS